MLSSHPRLALFSLIFIVFFFFPCSVFSQERSLKKIRVGVPAVSMGNMIIFFTREAKLFEKHDLDAEVIVVQGSGIASKALIGGSVQISPIATPTVINADLAGSDLVILAHTMPGVIQSLMVKPEITRAEDLKGKKIGVTPYGSLTDFLVRHLLKKKGLNPDKDAAVLQVGGDPERLAALRQGSIDAAALSHPAFVIAQRLGFVQLWDFSKELDYPWSEIVTRRAVIQKDRDSVSSYMKAHIEGIALFKKDRGLGRQVIKKVLKLNDEDLVNDAYELFAKTRLPAPYPNTKGMKTSFEYVALTRPEVWNHKPEDFVDASFVDELEKSGFIKRLYDKP
jgi:ABC-type nitrate/sulfonate/bicarbonate transport system substrate-binding protein